MKPDIGASFSNATQVTRFPFNLFLYPAILLLSIAFALILCKSYSFEIFEFKEMDKLITICFLFSLAFFIVCLRRTWDKYKDAMKDFRRAKALLLQAEKELEELQKRQTQGGGDGTGT
jgi:hypothetical protein